MRNILLVGLVIVIVGMGGYSVSKFKSANESSSPPVTPENSLVPDTSESSVIPIEYTEISPGGSVRVQCGDGSAGTKVTFNEGGFAGNIGLGGQTDISATVQDERGQPAGGLVEWRLYDRGLLRIDACQATFIAPDSIGTAYSTSATIQARVVSEATRPPIPTTAGEGGPVFAGFVATTKVTILSGGKPACYDPAGVAVSINSVPTTDSVRIIVDTPKVKRRSYSKRNITVRDGRGSYKIQIFVNGSLYGSETSAVGACQLVTVKF